MAGPAVPLLHPHSHSDSVDLSGCEWFYGRSNCVPSHCPHYHSGPDGLTVACESFHAGSSYIPSHCPHYHSGPDGLTVACESFHAGSSYIPSHCPYSNSGPVGLIDSSELLFHGRSSCVPSHCSHFCCVLVDLTGCEQFHVRTIVSLPYFFLILLAWQQVSDSIADPAVSLLTALTWAILILLAWQEVSDSMIGPAVSPLTVLIALWSCWLDSMWVILWQVQLCPFSLSSLLLLSCWLDRTHWKQWVNPCQILLCSFSLFSLPLWFCWHVSLWVISWQV